VLRPSPYHYSRVPRGHWNGELAITADLIRNAEGLRQGVIELRQLMQYCASAAAPNLRARDQFMADGFGALLAMVERDFSVRSVDGADRER